MSTDERNKGDGKGGLKARRGKGPKTLCPNCKCYRYGTCGCRKKG